MRILFVIIIVLIIGCVLHYLFPMIQVCGDSMYPTYLDGEIIFGSRIYRKSKLKKGDVIIYRSPNENRVVIKRIDHINKNNGELLFFCLGDNSDFSYDSRSYGYVSSKNLVCRVINQRRKAENVYH